MSPVHTPNPITGFLNQTRTFVAGLLSFVLVLVFTGFGSVLLYSVPAYAAANTLPFAARLTTATGANVASGTYPITFRIYNVATGGTPLWAETQTTTVSNGVFAVNLGDTNPLSVVNFASASLYLSFQLSPDPEMSPRYEIGSVPMAINSQTVGGASKAELFVKSANETVSGNTSFTGSVTVTGAASFANASTFTGGFSIQPASTSGTALLVNAGSGFSGNLIDLQVNGSARFTATSTGAVTTASTLTVSNGGIAVTGNSTVAGTLTTTGTINGLTVAAGVITAGSYQGSTITTQYGGTGKTSFSQGDLLIGNASGGLDTLPFTSDGLCLVTQGGIPGWYNCSAAAGAMPLQAAYDTGSTILTTSARNLAINLANTAVDSNFIVNIASGSTSKFAIEDNGSDIFRVTTATGTYVKDLTADNATVTNNLSVTGAITAGSTINGASISGTTINGAVISGGTLSAGSVTGGSISGGIITGGALSSSAVNGLSVASGVITSGTWQGSTVAATYGGTGFTSATANGLVYGNGANALQVTAAGTSGQLLLANASGVPTFVTLSNDATISATGALTLSNTGVTANTYGSASQVPVFTVDAKGRVTVASTTTITGTTPGGSAGGDLSGSFPNPTVAKINGVALGSTAATAANLLIGSGSAWVSQALSGDIAISSTGVAAIQANSVANADLVNSSLTVTAGTGLSGGGLVSLGGSVTLSNAGVTSLTGTANQISVSASTGAVTLSLPQNIASTSTPTFAGLTTTGNISVTGTVTASGLVQGGSGRFDGGVGVGAAPQTSTGLRVVSTNGANPLTGVNTNFSCSANTNCGASYAPVGQSNTFNTGTGNVTQAGNINITGVTNSYTATINNDPAFRTSNFTGLQNTVATTVTGQSVYGVNNNLAVSDALGFSTVYGVLNTVNFSGDYLYGVNNNFTLDTGSRAVGAYTTMSLPTATGSTVAATFSSLTAAPSATLQYVYGNRTSYNMGTAANNLNGFYYGNYILTSGSVAAGGTSPFSSYAYYASLGATNVTNEYGLYIQGAATGNYLQDKLLVGSTANTAGQVSITSATNQLALYNATSGSLVANVDSAGKATFTPSGSSPEIIIASAPLTVGGLINGATISGGSLSSSAVNGLSVASGVITAGSWQGSAVDVSYGGTGFTSATAKGLVYGNGTNALQVTAAGTSGQLLLANASGVPTFVTLSNDATVDATGALTLANSGVTANTYGSSSQVPVLSIDAKGRVTLASTTTITGVAPGGTAGGDLSGSYPNPTVAKINGVSLGSTTATAGNLLIGSGSAWVSQALTGDVTVTSSGVTAIGAGKVTNTQLANSSITVTSGTGISASASVSLGGTLTINNSGVTSLSGTTNQISVSASTGAVTLSLPQDIATSSTPTFAGLYVGSSNRYIYDDGSNLAISINGALAAQFQPAAGVAQANQQVFIRAGGSGGGASVGTSGSSLSIVAAAGAAIYTNTGGGAVSTATFLSDSFVNRIDFSGATTGNAVTIQGNGSDTNVSLALGVKGAGSVLVNSAAAYFGNGITNSSPVATTLNATGGSGSNIGGAALTLAGGIGTGTGAGGSLLFKYAPAGSAGSVANTLQTACVISGSNGSFSCPGVGTNSEQFGAGASVGSALESLAIGYYASAQDNQAVAIGQAALAGYNTAVLGTGASSSGPFNVAVGTYANTTGAFAVALGKSAAAGSLSVAVGANATALNGIALGREANASSFESVVIGYGAEATANYQFIVGSSTRPVTNLYFGSGVTAASPSAFTINGTGGLGSNIAGAAVNIAGGRGTGTGVGGNILFQYAPAGSTGSVANALQTACVISGTNGSFSCPGSASTSERFGADASVSSAAGGSLAIGYAAAVTGTYTNGIAIGSNSSAIGSSTVIGAGAYSLNTTSVVVGIGASATGSSYNTVAIGGNATANGESIAIGPGTTSTGGFSIVIGRSSTSSYENSVAIGVLANTTAVNQFVAGSSYASINNVYFGSGVSAASPQAFTLNGSGGLGTNIAGAAVNIAGGRGTGTGVGGNILFQYAPAGSTGSVANALQTACIISGTNGSLSCPSSDLTGERFGADASAISYSLAVGNGSSGSNGSTVVGNSALAYYNGISVGFHALASGSFSVAIGNYSDGGNNSVSIGFESTARSSSSVSLGFRAIINSGDDDAIALGANASTVADRGIAIGSSSVVNFTDSIAIGYLATATAANQLVVGSSGQAISNAYFGNGVTATSPQAFSLNATGGSGSNVAGASLSLAAGRGTGTGVGGNILFQYAPASSTGSAANTLQTACVISGADGSFGCPGSGSTTERFGIGSSVAGATNSLAVGTAATVSGNLATAIGQSAIASHTSTSLGAGANAAAYEAVAIGKGATVTNSFGVAIGSQAVTGVQHAIAIGYYAQTSSYNSIVLGSSALATAASQFVVGSTDSAISNTYFGNGVVNTSPNSTTINATGGSGPNVAGASLAIAAGRGTGTGTGGNVVLQAAAAGSTGSTANALTDRFIVLADGGVVVKNAPAQTANAFEIQNSSGATLASITNAGALNVSGLVNNGSFSVITTATPQLTVGYDASNKYTNTVSSTGAVAFNAVGSSAGFSFAQLVTAAGGITSASSGVNSEQFGYGATTSGNYNGLAVGFGSTIGGTQSIALGTQANATASNGIAIGFVASAAGTSIAIGPGSNAFAASIALGYQATTTANGQFVAGSDSVPMPNVYFGKGITAASPSAFTLNGTGGSGTDIAGAAINIAGGRGTGTGVGGNILFQYAPAGSTGAIANTLQTACVISGTNGSLSCPGSGSNSERFGAGASVSSNVNALAIGAGATVTGAQGLAIGPASSAPSNTIIIGQGVTTANTDSVVIGWAASSAGSTYDSVVVGRSASGAGGTVALGASSTSTGSYSVAVGTGATATHNSSIALGVSSTSTAANQLVIGSVNGTISNIYFGNGVVNTSPAAFIINGTGGSGSNIAGASVTLAGGRGTGTGVGGNIIFQYAAASGSSGSTANTLQTACQISGTNGTLSCPGSGANSERFGTGANTSTATGAIAIGSGASALGNNAIAIGLNATATAASSIVIGPSANSNNASSTNSVAIGVSSIIGNSQYSVAVGNGIALGDGTQRSVAIGGAVNIGGSTGNVIALGYGATAFAASQFVVGSTSAPITNMFIGRGISAAAPSGIVINATGGSGTNVAGAAITIAGGIGTGTAVGGNIVLQYAPASGVSSSTANTLLTACQVSGTNGSFSCAGSGANSERFGASSATSTFTGATAIGSGASVGGNSSIALGYGVSTSGANQFVVGSSVAPIANMYLGNGINATSPQNVTINAASSSTANANTAGAILALAGGLGTGTGAGGDLILQTAAASGVANTQGSLVTRVQVKAAGETLITGQAAAQKALIIQGVASQSANILEVQNSGGSILANFSSTGALSVINTSSTQFVIGYDASNKLNFSISSVGAVTVTGSGSGSSINFQPSTTFGGVADNTQFSTTGVQTFNGAARPYSEVTLLPKDAVVPASNGCTLTATDDTNVSYNYLDCATAVDSSAHWQIRMPQNYVNGSNIQVVVQWMDADSASTNPAQFNIGYTAIPVGGTWAGAARTDVTGVGVASAGQNKVNASTVTLTTPSVNASDLMNVRVLRKGAATTADTLPDSARILQVVVRYLVGS